MPTRLNISSALVSATALALLATAALAGEVVLTPRAGGAPTVGELIEAESGVYRLATQSGEVELLARAVTCAGDACPPPQALVTRFTLAGDDLVPGLLPALLEGYALWTGAELEQTDDSFRLSDASGPLAEIEIVARPAEGSGGAMLALTDASPAEGARAKTFALDAVALATAPTNGLSAIDAAAIARVARGEISSWKALGGADVPINIHAAPLRGAALERAQALGWQLAEGIAMAEHARLQDAAIATANDPFGLSALPASALGPARALALRDACGFLLHPDRFDILSGAYPARFDLSMQAMPESLDAPLVAEFFTYLDTSAAAAVTADFGLVPLSLARRPLAAEGERLARAILAAGGEVPLEDVQEMVATLADAERLSAALRLEQDDAALDPRSRALAERFIAEVLLGNLADKVVILAGFSDAAGPQAVNRVRSVALAERVRAHLVSLAPEGAFDDVIFQVRGFGEAAPLVCEDAPGGAQTNRRVEIWLRDRRPDEE